MISDYRPRNTKFSDFELMALLSRGLSYSEAARVFGVTRQAIWFRRKHAWTENEEKLLEAMKGKN